MISILRPVSSSIRRMKRELLDAARQAWVAMARLWVTPARRILATQTRKAASVRSIAGSDSAPLALKPSPRRTEREKASITRKPPRPSPRAISSRQLLVPRSIAA